MKHTTILKSSLLAAVALGLALSVRAGTAPPSGPVLEPVGLLGQTYAGLTYSYLNLDRQPVNADSFGFRHNQSLSPGLDGLLSYDWTQTGLAAGARRNQQMIGGALRGISYARSWGKPYVEAGMGYAWTRSAGTRDNSLVWEIAGGAELQLAPAFTVTPFVQYQDARDLAGGSVWSIGAKANCWIDRQWAITGGETRDDNHTTTFTIGTNFRY